MNKTVYAKKICILLTGILCIASLSGCGSKKGSQVKEIKKAIYQKAVYETVKAQKGDIEPTAVLILTPDEVEQVDYTVDEENLEVDEILVNVGEDVKQGQTLVTFKAEDIRKAIEKYSSEVENKQLLLDHYTRLANVEKKKDYKVEIAELTDDVNLAKLYLEEEMERLNRCSIIADRDGTVSYISKVLMNGYVAPSTCMVSEVCGKGTYACTTEDKYNFEVGDIYMASNDSMECEMQILSIADTESGARKIVFEPTTDFFVPSGEDTFTITIKKNSLKNAVYVVSKAIHEKDNKQFVYVVSDSGFLDAVYVTTGEYVDDYVEIKSGLNGGEEVAVK